ncbi:hypothetical protein LTR37_001386 [Vermiconidia calcicola]|uniref:Uncharacterized protein n=1 Tax=Vermiconidia calcicola TaxID=1690605 RepID=A0ACC3NVX1_9PEZI|nr:hypothetical protein LTR37_001386 [Vermiconidia calcicola]
MPAPTVMVIAAAIEMSFTILHILKVKTPVQINSVLRGERFRPGIYFVVEDVVAVDGNGGLPYRTALDLRYRCSPIFRRMLVRLSMFWSLSALLIGGAIIAVIWITPESVAFGIGWIAPFVWGGIWTPVTIKWVQRELLKEKRAWELSL